MSPSRLLFLALLLPLSAAAEPFTTARDIVIPAKLLEPGFALAELDIETRLLPPRSLRLIDDRGMAIGFERIEGEYALQNATILASPPAAQTVPLTNAQSVLDGSFETVFQPQAARQLAFRFRFPREVTPTVLNLSLSSGDLEDVRVRLGQDEATLRDAFVGVPETMERIPLSAERTRVAEVVLTMKKGFPLIEEITFLELRAELYFQTQPGKRFVLLSGDADIRNPVDPELFFGVNPPAITVVAPGPPRAPSPVEQGDHDGVPDTNDNCPAHWNPKQEDEDKDGVGDTCDLCPSVGDASQADADRDGQGDACEDEDKDGVANALDNCRTEKNPRQEDEDKDGTGNVCDKSDDRFTSGRTWLLTASMAAVVLVLAGMGVMILRRTPKES